MGGGGAGGVFVNTNDVVVGRGGRVNVVVGVAGCVVVVAYAYVGKARFIASITDIGIIFFFTNTVNLIQRYTSG